MSIDLIKENSFTLKRQEADDIPETLIMTDADYADDLVLLKCLS